MAKLLAILSFMMLDLAAAITSGLAEGTILDGCTASRELIFKSITWPADSNRKETYILRANG